MIAETGHYALILALGVAIVQTLLPLIGARYRDPRLSAVAIPAAQAMAMTSASRCMANWALSRRKTTARLG